MTARNSESQLQREMLLPWLMHCHRNLFLAAPGVPDQEIVPPWAKAAAMEEFEIDYEPRCLAVSSEGPRVAVGTKAGSIHLALWSESECRWQIARRGQARVEMKPRRAIRALSMLDDSTLVAGWRTGDFLILTLGSSPREDDIQNVGSKELVATTDTAPLWLRRFSRLVNLHPYNQVPDEGDLVLGLSIGDRVHLLSRHGGKYQAISQEPQEIPFLRWKREWGRLIDATWSHRRIWLLSSKGFIIPYRREPHRDNRLVRGDVLQLKFHRRGGAFRALSGCTMGLSVLASDHVTFLRFNFDEKDPKTGEQLPKLDLSGAHWFYLPDAMDCTVCLPYLPSESLSHTKDPFNPIWTVVTTGKNELHWVAWPDFPRDLPKSDPLSNSWLPWRAPGFFTNVGKGALYARFGWPSGQPPFLAVGSRDHKLRIVSVLNRQECEETIQSLAVHEDRKVAGAELWSLQEIVRRDFDLLVSEEKDWTRPKQLLRGTTEDNLRILVATVYRAWKEAPKGDEAQRLQAKCLVRDWMLRLLQRAYEYGPELTRELARSAYDRIGALRAEEGDGLERWNDLGLFANFLRKWVLRGYTYEEKPVHLRQLYEWNHQCARDLDALAYLTRLFRRRVDPEWTVHFSEGGTAPAVWALAACPPGSLPEPPFSIVSFTDGSLSVFSNSGQRVPWKAARSHLRSLHSSLLEIDPQGHRLHHCDAQSFVKQYRHGPYARSILLMREDWTGKGDVTSYLLFFALRGWRAQDREGQDDKKPRVFALRIRPVFEGRELQEIRIEGVDSKPIEEELYGLCQLDLPDRTTGVHRILAGTSGTAKDEDSGRWVPCPFREIEVRSSARRVKITIPPFRVSLVPKGQRSLFRNDTAASQDTAYNPCWVLVFSGEHAGGPRVWGGFQDGSIRGFQRRPIPEPATQPTWIEGGWLVDSDGRQSPSSQPRPKGIKVSAAVWSLHVVQRPDQRRYLAYGTGDGTIGLVDLAAVEGEESREFCHLLHTREASPICALKDYREGSGQRLLAVSQKGIVCIFSLDVDEDFEWPKAASAGKEDLSHRFLFPGLRLDHFSLRHSARGMVLLEDPALDGGDGPCLLVGSVEGSIHKHRLRYPRKSRRRKEAREELTALMPSKADRPDSDGSGIQELDECVGKKNGLAWLRMFDLNDLNMVKFSLWRELHNAKPAATLPPDPEQIERYILHLRNLADEVYSRRPFSSEPAKVLWEVTGRFADEVLGWALDHPGSDFDICLDVHRKLAVAIDDLCNRWIGFHQSFEAKVLVHSFDALFDWTHIVLLAGNHEPTEKVASLRKFFLHKIVQRRLYHSDSMVALETLRILNSAMIRAVAHARPRQLKQNPGWIFGLRPETSPDRSVAFYDLMTMVGDLGERLQDSLVPANPFATEIIRFFALSLLLVPSSALIIGQVVSESRLTEHGDGLARAVSDQAKEIASQREIDYDKRAIRRFDDYCSVEAKLDMVWQWPDFQQQVPLEEPWLFLLHEAHECIANPGTTPSDEEFLGELKHILVAASWLSRLDDKELGDARDAVKEARARLERSEEKEWIYFKHSAAFLRELRQVRKEVRALAGFEGNAPSIKEAIERCEKALREIENADLFQPQRTHYQKVILEWRQYLLTRAENAIRVLDIMDEFNRHVYRTSADNLMTSITELAMQVAPFSYYDGERQQTLRRLIQDRLEGYPLIHEVFDRGDRLVDYTHLSGTLLEVARDHLGRHGELSGPEIEDHITGDDVWEEIEREGKARGLSFDLRKSWDPSLRETQIPGSRATWNAIVQEYARNVSRYDRSGEGAPSSPCLKWAIPPHERCVLISGSLPFLNTLSPTKRQTLSDDQGHPEMGKVEDLIRSLWEPRIKAHEEGMSSSSGMGLHLIKEISGLWRLLEVELILFDPTESFGKHEKSSEEERIKWPLCLKVSWASRERE